MAGRITVDDGHLMICGDMAENMGHWEMHPEGEDVFVRLEGAFTWSWSMMTGTTRPRGSTAIDHNAQDRKSAGFDRACPSGCSAETWAPKTPASSIMTGAMSTLPMLAPLSPIERTKPRRRSN